MTPVERGKIDRRLKSLEKYGRFVRRWGPFTSFRVTPKTKGKNRSNYPTQANNGLEWAT